MPHGFCMRWDFWLLILHVVSDALIALAYFSIPAALVTFIRRRKDLRFGFMFWLFSAFIFWCGVTHVMAILTLWQPDYWLEGWFKAVTAVVSVATAAILWPILPSALKIPSPAQLEEANARLQREIREREKAQIALNKLNQELHQIVLERTGQLEKSAEELHRLQGHLVKVCAWTKQIEDEGKWISLEEFFRRHLGIEVTHGVSSDGAARLQQEIELLFEAGRREAERRNSPPA